MVKIKKSEEKTYAFLTTFLSIIGFLIALISWKEDKYILFYAKQSLGVFLVFAASAAIAIIPIIGWITAPIIYIIGIVLWVMSWAYALSGKQKIVPIIGEWANKIKL